MHTHEPYRLLRRGVFVSLCGLDLLVGGSFGEGGGLGEGGGGSGLLPLDGRVGGLAFVAFGLLLGGSVSLLFLDGLGAALAAGGSRRPAGHLLYGLEVVGLRFSLLFLRLQIIFGLLRIRLSRNWLLLRSTISHDLSVRRMSN